MYRLAPVLDVPPLDPGTVVLLEGPPMSGKSRLARRLLDVGFESGEPAIVVATKKPAEWHRDRHGDDVPLFIVDCVSGAAGRVDDRGMLDERTYVVGSPADLTGIGIGVSKFLEAARSSGPEPHPVRLYLDSLSTLLAYTTPDQLYRFLHALTGRIRAAGGLGLCLAHTSSVDEHDVARFRSLFDAGVETRETESGPEIRFRGLDGVAIDWKPMSLSEVDKP